MPSRAGTMNRRLLENVRKLAAELHSVSKLKPGKRENLSRALHQSRVVSRRIESLYHLFPNLEKNIRLKPLKPLLKKIRKKLGPSRELCVNLEIWEKKYPHHKATRELIRSTFQEVKKSLKDEPKRFLQSIASIQKDLEAKPIRLGTKLQHRPKAQTKKLLHSLQKTISDIHHVHSLRIDIKKLRYQLEVLEDVYDLDSKTMIPILKTFQKQLGKIHDQEVFLSFLSMMSRKAEKSKISKALRKARKIEEKSLRYLIEQWQNQGLIKREGLLNQLKRISYEARRP